MVKQEKNETTIFVEKGKKFSLRFASFLDD
jgi:hypothetical protein